MIFIFVADINWDVIAESDSVHEIAYTHMGAPLISALQKDSFANAARQ